MEQKNKRKKFNQEFKDSAIQLVEGGNHFGTATFERCGIHQRSVLYVVRKAEQVNVDEDSKAS